MSRPICVSCKKPYVKNPRQKIQRYCSSPACQRERKNEWQRRKMKSDPKYRKDQKQATKDWHYKKPGYWKEYRKQNPQKKLRNTLLQRKRNQIRRFREDPHESATVRGSQNVIAKMDVSKANRHAAFTECWIVPLIAKMDVLKGYLSVNYTDLSPNQRFVSDCKDGRYSYFE